MTSILKTTRTLFGIAAAVTFLTAASVIAQETTQASVDGVSGTEPFSVQVTGTNGVTYNCRPGISNLDGTPVRYCVQAGGGNALQAGELGPAAGAAALAIVALAVLAGDDDNTATTSTP